MQMNIQTETIAVTKMFPESTKPPMRRLYAYVEPEMYQEVIDIAQHEGMEISATVRELLALAMRYYKFKQGVLNPTNPQNTKTFYCQVCSALTGMRKMHKAQILNEEYHFCENCFFAGRHKNFIVTMVNRS
jgi:hypothetical protein